MTEANTPPKPAEAPTTIDKLTGTSPDDRKAFLADAKESLTGAVQTALDAVKDNPKTAAAIAAGAAATVAGAAYGATKLAKGTTAPKKASSGRPAAKKD